MAGDVKIVPLKPSHLEALGDAELCVFINDTSWAAIADGEAVAAGGICEPYWPGRGHCWFAKRPGHFDFRWWPSVTRAVKAAADKALESGMCRRLEMTVYDDDDAAKRWAEKLGFHAESECKRLMQDGRDGWMYVRLV